MKWTDWSADDIVVLRRMWAANRFAKDIGEVLDKSPASILGKARRLGLGSHDAMRNAYNAQRQSKKPKKRGPVAYAGKSQEGKDEWLATPRPQSGLFVTHGRTHAERAELLAQIPDDNRTLTGRLCGDPLPGRSALDMRQQGRGG